MPLEEPVCLFNIDKVLDDVSEYPGTPPRWKLLGKVLSLLERLVKRFAKHLGALVLIGLLVPRVPDLVEPRPVDWGAAHGTRGAVGPLQVPTLDTSFTENVTAAQFLEGTRLGIAHRALHFGSGLLPGVKTFGVDRTGFLRVGVEPREEPLVPPSLKILYLG
jgi:hypothetical protein